MRAFTQLGEKVNISLFNDTLTVYPKKNGNKSLHYALYRGMYLVQVELECEYVEGPNLLESEAGSRELGIIRFVHRDDLDHDELHQDGLNMDDSHWHAKFIAPIDERKLQEILAIFVQNQVVSEVEKAAFITAYHQANELEMPAAAEEALPLPGAAEEALPLPGAEVVDVLAALPDQPKTIQYTLEELDFKAQLEIINKKATELRMRGEDKAADSAATLHTSLSDAVDQYAQNRTLATYSQFKAVANQAIDDARPELEHHRGWKEILGNIGLAIGLLGIGYIAVGMINLAKTGRFSFFRTDSAQKVDNVANHFAQIPVPVY